MRLEMNCEDLRERVAEMGDHRAEIHCQMKLHGKEYKLDLDWVNYSPDNDGCDSRVTEFFERSWNEAYARWQEEVYESQKAQRIINQEKQERKLLQELQEKYGVKAMSE